MNPHVEHTGLAHTRVLSTLAVMAAHPALVVLGWHSAKARRCRVGGHWALLEDLDRGWREAELGCSSSEDSPVLLPVGQQRSYVVPSAEWGIA